jgi:hypothetical protein
MKTVPKTQSDNLANAEKDFGAQVHPSLPHTWDPTAVSSPKILWPWIKYFQG